MRFVPCLACMGFVMCCTHVHSWRHLRAQTAPSSSMQPNKHDIAAGAGMAASYVT